MCLLHSGSEFSMTAWFLLIFGAIQNIVMAQVVISTNVTSYKDGVPVEFVCNSSTPGSCTYGFWKNNITLCACYQGQCVLFGGDRYQCFGNDSTIRLIIISFNQSLDTFPLNCQCGSYTAIFEFSPTSNVTGLTTSQLPANVTGPTTSQLPANVTGPTTSQLPVDMTGAIVGGTVGGLVGLVGLVGLIGAIIFYIKKRNRCGEKTGNEEEQSALGSAGESQGLPVSSNRLFNGELMSVREPDDRRDSNDEENIEMSQTTRPC